MDPTGSTIEDTLSTGINDLDNRLGGGFPSGSIVCLKTGAATQSELFLYSMATERDTLYISTVRNEQAVKDTFNEIADLSEEEMPYVTYAPPDSPLQDVIDLVRKTAGDFNIIIDSIELLESEDRSKYQNFLNELKDHLANTGAVAILHSFKGTDNDNEFLTDAMADVLIDLESDVDGTNVEHFIHVPKYRLGEAFNQRIKLKLTDGIKVDTSRDIA